jgi:Flp pilus assembly protein TadG
MSHVSNNRRRPQLGQSGTSSLEFALVGIPFLFMLIAGMDLGRYFITQHSLRTLVSEAVRSAVINCFGLTSCNYQTAVPSPSAVWAKVPFLSSTGPNASLTASQSYNGATGIRTITATATYGFTFFLPTWTGLTGTITETTKRNY